MHNISPSWTENVNQKNFSDIFIENFIKEVQEGHCINRNLSNLFSSELKSVKTELNTRSVVVLPSVHIFHWLGSIEFIGGGERLTTVYLIAVACTRNLFTFG